MSPYTWREILQRIRALEDANEELERYLSVAIKDERLLPEWRRQVDEIGQGIARLYMLLDAMP